jgi:hypothetical protein
MREKSKVEGRKLKASLWAALFLLTFNLRLSTALGQTFYTEPWTSSLDGWSYTQGSCSGTCADGLSTDGNPADSVSDKMTGRNKAETGYWSKSTTWEGLGVPAGDVVNTVDGQWDDFTIATGAACTSSTTAGMQIFDSSNAAEITASTLEPATDVSGDTTAWTTHNPTGAVAVNSGYQASTTAVTLRFNINPAGGNNGSAACEVRGDNYKLTIASTTPSGRNRVIVIGGLFGESAADSGKRRAKQAEFSSLKIGGQHGER